MSEERFDRIEKKLTSHDARFDGIDARFDGIDARFDGVDARFDHIKETLARHDARFDALDQRIGVLHEDVLNKIAASTERDAVSRQEFKEAIADLTEAFGRRIDPLETAMRATGFKIPRQKRARKKPRLA